MVDMGELCLLGCWLNLVLRGPLERTDSPALNPSCAICKWHDLGQVMDFSEGLFSPLL